MAESWEDPMEMTYAVDSLMHIVLIRDMEHRDRLIEWANCIGEWSDVIDQCLEESERGKRARKIHRRRLKKELKYLLED